MQILETGAGPIMSLAFTPVGDLMIGLQAGMVYLYSGELKPIQRPIRVANGQNASVMAILTMPDGRVITGTTAYATFEDPAGALQLLQNDPVAGMASFNDSTLVIGFSSQAAGPGSVYLVRCTETVVFQKPCFKEPKGVRAVAAHVPSFRIAWSSGHQKVMLTDPRRQDPKTIALKHTSPAIAFHPDGHTLAVAQEWGVKLFDTERLVETRTLAGHKGRVVTLAYSIDGRILATGSWDGSVRLWNAETGQSITTYEGHTGKVYTLAFSPDGTRLAAAGEKGTIVIWDLE